MLNENVCDWPSEMSCVKQLDSNGNPTIICDKPFARFSEFVTDMVRPKQDQSGLKLNYTITTEDG